MKLCTGTSEEVGMSTSRLKCACDFAQELVNQNTNYPAVVAIAARHGIIILQEAFGQLRPEHDSPLVELDSIFPLSSLSKPVTATLAMILLEDGLLSLNHPVVEYIPEFVSEGKDKVMVHHLLTHTTGITTGDVNEHAEKKKGSVEIPPSDKTQHPEVNEYLFLRYDAPLSRPPGEAMTYATFNYDLLGEIVRRVSGKSLDDFARERLFGPLGMNDSYYETPDSIGSRMIELAVPNPHIDFYLRVPVGADGVISTAMDMAIFGQMFLNGGAYGDKRILSPASVIQMTQNQIPGTPWRYGEESGPEANWGYGWGIHGGGKYMDAQVLCSPKTFSHGGSGGVFVRLWVDPVYEIVGCFFSVSLATKRIYREASLFADMVTAAVMDL